MNVTGDTHLLASNEKVAIFQVIKYNLMRLKWCHFDASKMQPRGLKMEEESQS